jgi:hypothetical protein
MTICNYGDMMDDVGANLTAINKTLERQNEIIQQMLNIMPRPAGKFISILEIIVLFAGVFGFISIADIIIKWAIGG